MCMSGLLIVLLLLFAASSYFTVKSDTEGSKLRDITRISNGAWQEKIPTNQLYNLPYNNGENYCDIDAACGNIKCSHIPEHFDPGEVISNFIENIFKVKCSAKSVINLTLEKSRFNDNELQAKWLKTNITIASLILTDCYLTTLSDRAFSSSIFSKMTKLQLKDNNISILRKTIFHYLPRLEYLSIVNNEIKEVEKNLLQDIATNLANLELENSINNIEVLRNITGADDLRNVKELALRYNRITIIDSLLFTGVSRIESLYLQQSNIQTICSSAFEPISGFIRQIFINYNNIMTLPKGLFESIILRNSSFLLSIDNNPWHCNCDLQWMQDIILHFEIVQKIPTCKSPKKNSGKLFTDANFCDQQGTPKTTDDNSNTPSLTSLTEPISTTNTIKTTTNNPETSSYRLTIIDDSCVKTDIIIIAFVSSLILMCFLSAILTFIIIRRYPTMLRGNKRIVIVKRRNLDVMVLPKGVSNDVIQSANKNTIPTISQNMKENGYIVFLPPTRNSTDKNSTSPTSSEQSDNTSYISSIEPTLSELKLWRLKRYKYTRPDAPPLPNPHHIAQPLPLRTDIDKHKFNYL